MTATQQEQVERAQAGDRAAFEALFEAYRRPIFVLVLRLLGSPEDAADACQETFVRAWVYLSRLRDPATFPAWLQRIAIRVCQDRPAAVPVSPLAEEEAEVSDPRAEEALDGVLTRLDVQRALQQLPLEQRAVTVLRFLHGLSYAEIADTLDCPIGTVMSRLYHARRTLQRLLADG
jgi:RNA polymerase sigma-70 factor (ECF subfamily)